MRGRSHTVMTASPSLSFRHTQAAFIARSIDKWSDDKQKSNMPVEGWGWCRRSDGGKPAYRSKSEQVTVKPHRPISFTHGVFLGCGGIFRVFVHLYRLGETFY